MRPMSSMPSRSGKRRSKASASPEPKIVSPTAAGKLPTVAASAVTNPAGAAAAAPGEPAPANSLTPDEQMARFAKELQENDWGHQPC